MHWLVVHKFKHEVLKRPIRVHKLGIRADKVVGHMPHTPKEGILVYEFFFVYPVGHLNSEGEHLVVVVVAAWGIRYKDNLFSWGVL